MAEDIKQFVVNAQETGGTVLTCKSGADLGGILLDILGGEEAIHIDARITADYPDIKNYLNQQGKRVYEDLSISSDVSTGCCYAEYGIASSGSLAVKIDDSFNNKFTLLPSRSVILINSDNILNEIGQLFSQIKKQNYVIITGPSATADMGSLVRGAHGPEKLIIVLI